MSVILSTVMCFFWNLFLWFWVKPRDFLILFSRRLQYILSEKKLWNVLKMYIVATCIFDNLHDAVHADSEPPLSEGGLQH